MPCCACSPVYAPVPFNSTYKTQHGAHVGDVFMSLIHTCELCGANPFDYLTELERHTTKVISTPQDWMPWNYRQALIGSTSPSAVTS